jgi:hypothetical protein
VGLIVWTILPSPQLRRHVHYHNVNHGHDYDDHYNIDINTGGETPTTMPNAMKNYMSNLGQRHPSPLRIRIGGNSMDGSTWVPTQTQMIVLTDPNAYYNDVPVNFGPTFFDVLNSMADTVGEMAFIIGLSMRDPDDDTNVIELAAAADQMLGDRLDSMLLGNVGAF